MDLSEIDKRQALPLQEYFQLVSSYASLYWSFYKDQWRAADPVEPG